MVNPGVDIAESKDHPFRTEFVIVFIWKEPTPSDKLRGLAASTPPSAAPPPAQPGQPAPAQPAPKP